MIDQMKLLFTLLIASAAFAQTPHSVTLNWVDTANPTGTTYNVYRASGTCSSSPIFSGIPINTLPVAGKTYLDTPIAPGNWCYRVTAIANGIESTPSNTASAPVPAFPPSTLTIVVQ